MLLQQLINVASLFVTMGMAYYSLRLITLMRKGRLERAWVYIASGSLSLSVGLILFTLARLLMEGGMMEVIPPSLGGSIMLVGGILLLLGLRSQHNFWAAGR